MERKSDNSDDIQRVIISAHLLTHQVEKFKPSHSGSRTARGTDTRDIVQDLSFIGIFPFLLISTHDFQIITEKRRSI